MPKTYTSVPSVSTGDVYQASTYNTYTAQNVNNLIVPAAVSAYHNTTQSLTNNAQTDLVFNSEYFDTDSMHDTSTNTGRLTITTPGIYVVTLNVAFAANATGQRILTILLDGTRIASHGITAGSAAVIRLGLTTIQSINNGSYLSATGFQDSGGALNALADDAANNTFARFSATWVGRTS